MSDTINDLLAQVPTGRAQSGASEGLDPEVAGLLEDFRAWLERSDGKSEATARAYRSYVAGALAAMDEGKSWADLSTDVRSAVRAFTRYALALRQAAEAYELTEA